MTVIIKNKAKILKTLYFSSFQEQISKKKVTILNETFKLPEKVLVYSNGIINNHNIKINQKLKSKILKKINLYNQLNHIYNIQNMVD